MGRGWMKLIKVTSLLNPKLNKIKRRKVERKRGGRLSYALTMTHLIHLRTSEIMPLFNNPIIMLNTSQVLEYFLANSLSIFSLSLGFCYRSL